MMKDTEGKDVPKAPSLWTEAEKKDSLGIRAGMPYLQLWLRKTSNSSLTVLLVKHVGIFYTLLLKEL